MAEQLVAGSEHLIEGVFRDEESDETLTPIDLTLATALSIRIKQSDGVVKIITAVADADQENNPGKYAAQLSTTDLDAIGKAKLQAWLTIGGRTHKSSLVERAIQESLS